MGILQFSSLGRVLARVPCVFDLSFFGVSLGGLQALEVATNGLPLLAVDATLVLPLRWDNPMLTASTGPSCWRPGATRSATPNSYKADAVDSSLLASRLGEGGAMRLST